MKKQIIFLCLAIHPALFAPQPTTQEDQTAASQDNQRRYAQLPDAWFEEINEERAFNSDRKNLQKAHEQD